MEETNKKECPKCKSCNIFDQGDRVLGQAVSCDRNKSFPEPNLPVYQCRDCGNLFIFTE